MKKDLLEQANLPIHIGAWKDAKEFLGLYKLLRLEIVPPFQEIYEEMCERRQVFRNKTKRKRKAQDVLPDVLPSRGKKPSL